MPIQPNAVRITTSQKYPGSKIALMMIIKYSVGIVDQISINRCTAMSNQPP